MVNLLKVIFESKKYLSRSNTTLNLFHATSLFLYLLEKSENQIFSDVFRGYRMGRVARNGLNNFLYLRNNFSTSTNDATLNITKDSEKLISYTKNINDHVDVHNLPE